MLKLQISLIIIIVFSFLIIGCENKNQSKGLTEDSENENQKLDNERTLQNLKLDSLSNIINNLKFKKDSIAAENRRELSRLGINELIDSSFFDHIILLCNDLDNLNNLFSRKLGFFVEPGRNHENGISNNFIKFKDNSYIELISVQKPKDSLAILYSMLMQEDINTPFFSIRTTDIEELKKLFQNTDFKFSSLLKNKSYAILSQTNYIKNQPFFFIQYYGNNINGSFHPNGANGIAAVWLESADLRSNALQYAELGFKPSAKFRLHEFKSELILLEGMNFDIYLGKGENNRIVGCTLITSNLEQTKEYLENKTHSKFIINSTHGGRSIVLSKKVTESIWLEFLQK